MQQGYNCYYRSGEFWSYPADNKRSDYDKLYKYSKNMAQKLCQKGKEYVVMLGMLQAITHKKR